MADNFIYVVSGRADNRVALWERDTRHPDGEIWITSKTRPVQAFETSAITEKLHTKELVKTTKAGPKITEE
jgi:hypothetical protein